MLFVPRTNVENHTMGQSRVVIILTNGNNNNNNNAKHHLYSPHYIKYNAKICLKHFSQISSEIDTIIPI